MASGVGVGGQVSSGFGVGGQVSSGVGWVLVSVK